MRRYEMRPSLESGAYVSTYLGGGRRGHYAHGLDPAHLKHRKQEEDRSKYAQTRSGILSRSVTRDIIERVESHTMPNSELDAIRSQVLSHVYEEGLLHDELDMVKVDAERPRTPASELLDLHETTPTNKLSDLTQHIAFYMPPKMKSRVSTRRPSRLLIRMLLLYGVLFGIFVGIGEGSTRTNCVADSNRPPSIMTGVVKTGSIIDAVNDVSKQLTPTTVNGVTIKRMHVSKSADKFNVEFKGESGLVAGSGRVDINPTQVKIVNQNQIIVTTGISNFQVSTENGIIGNFLKVIPSASLNVNRIILSQVFGKNIKIDGIRADFPELSPTQQRLIQTDKGVAVQVTFRSERGNLLSDGYYGLMPADAKTVGICNRNGKVKVDWARNNAPATCAPFADSENTYTADIETLIQTSNAEIATKRPSFSFPIGSVTPEHVSATGRGFMTRSNVKMGLFNKKLDVEVIPLTLDVKDDGSFHTKAVVKVPNMGESGHNPTDGLISGWLSNAATKVIAHTGDLFLPNDLSPYVFDRNLDITVLEKWDMSQLTNEGQTVTVKLAPKKTSDKIRGVLPRKPPVSRFRYEVTERTLTLRPE